MYRASRIEDVVIAMDSPYDHYYDLSRNIIYTVNDSITPEAERETLLIPKVGKAAIINDYLSGLAYNTKSGSLKNLKMMCRNEAEGSENAFHRYINENELSENWIEFKWNYLYDCALKWCKTHGIYF